MNRFKIMLTEKSFNLPDDVFEGNEEKPQKKSSKGANGKKRGAAEVIPLLTLFYALDQATESIPPVSSHKLTSLQENQPPAKRQQASVAAAG